MTKWKLFTAAFLVTTVAMTVVNYVNYRSSATKRPKLTHIVDRVFITSQLHPDAMTRLLRRGIRTLVDIRPDGEAPEQPSSADIERAAQANKISFYYIPVPHESIPDAAVDGLSAAMKASPPPMVLYCRTGRRAVRLFALAEATRSGGPSADEIQRMVKEAGFTAEDLRDDIAKRINSRAKQE